MTSGLAILTIGFFLGMRHATDPDHVIAVSTIVSRERTIAKAALIGILWGCGHTLTIVAVGAAIISFGLAIPARASLTMEFSVGLMLILLGVLNLTGAMKWISEKFSPAHPRVTGEHAHLHEHDSHVHFHWHSHAPAAIITAIVSRRRIGCSDLLGGWVFFTRCALCSLASFTVWQVPPRWLCWC